MRIMRLFIQMVVCSTLAITSISGQDSSRVHYIRGQEDETTRELTRRNRYGDDNTNIETDIGINFESDSASRFLVTLIARVNALTDKDFHMLEKQFAEAYNSLTARRYIIGVDIDRSSTSILDSGSMTISKTYIYEVEANCPGQCTLTDDTRSISSPDETNPFRALQGKKNSYKKGKKRT
mmetsp:Transcript_24106/g.35719  ORF Transcript_24106/g.35719 Transcript_24106/m.35719 type:complete len:180 (+) Transcript_24106:238-777(+)